MSTTAGVFSPLSSRISSRDFETPMAIAGIAGSQNKCSDVEATGLVRQLFSSSLGRKRIFLASTAAQASIFEFCERIGQALAGLHGGSVALVHGAVKSDLGVQTTNLVQVGDNFSRLSAEQFQAEFAIGSREKSESSFDYFLFGANMADSAAPLFGQVCDGAVLVIEANRTRREAALRAKSTLLSWNVKLLGAVLINRTFPVPESIYRRL